MHSIMSTLLSSKTKGLLKDINQWVGKDKSNNTQLMHWQRQATQLLKLDAVGGYIVLGALASLSADINNIHAHYKNALALAPSNPEVLSNYATCLHNTGFFGEAADLAFRAYHLAPDNLQWLSRLIEHCMAAGRFHRAKKLLNTRTYKLSPYILYQRDEFIHQLVDFMDEKSVTDNDLEKLIKTVISVLHQHQIYYFDRDNIEIYSLEDDHNQWYHYGVKLYALSMKELIHLCFNLAETLVEAETAVQTTSDFFVPSFHLAE